MNTKSIGLIAITTLAIIGARHWYATSFKVPTMQEQLAVYDTEFDQSMRADEFKKVSEGNNEALYGFFKDLYEAHRPKKMAVSEQVKIPKIIHHIWMGSKMRVEDEQFYHSWRTHHPDWTFIFWTDNQLNYDKGDVVVKSFDELTTMLHTNRNKPQRIVVDVNNLQFENRQYFDKAINYGERGDILDYEIVYRYGGVYVDCDFECYKPLDLFHYTYDFYTGIQPLDTNRVQLGAALFGAVPKHPILANCVANIKNTQHIKQIILKTGPLYFTQIFYMVAGKTGLKDVALPASYFYPRGYEQRAESKETWCKNESFATHHWAGSWLKPEGFVKKVVS